MDDLELRKQALERLEQLNACLSKTEEPIDYKGPLKCGVDLGTANVLIVVLTEDNVPLAVRSTRAKVVRDGIVVDFRGSVRLITRMKEEIEDQLGRRLTKAACAIPPGVHPGSVRIIQNVLEASDFDVAGVADEPEAAALALGVRNGAVIDVGGGTTGISVLENGKAVFSADEATGGTHMSLVLAGANNMSFDEAEDYKLNNSSKPEVYVTIRPVIEKMAYISKKYMQGYDVKNAYVVGGACCFPNFAKVFNKVLGVPTELAEDPLLVTPLGIAMCCEPFMSEEE